MIASTPAANASRRVRISRSYFRSKPVSSRSSFTAAMFLICLVLEAKPKVESVSAQRLLSAEMVAMSVVKQFDPNEDCSNRVIFESRYGMWLRWLASAAMTFPSAESELQRAEVSRKAYQVLRWVGSRVDLLPFAETLTRGVAASVRAQSLAASEVHQVEPATDHARAWLTTSRPDATRAWQLLAALDNDRHASVRSRAGGVHRRAGRIPCLSAALC